MKAEELRIGNIIWRPCCYDKVVEIREKGIFGLDNLRGVIPFSELKPIPLSDELLEKSGFKYDSHRVFVHKDNDILLFDAPNDWSVDDKYPIGIEAFQGNYLLGVPTNGEIILRTKSLHHLQNMYYAVTGKELEVEL